LAFLKFFFGGSRLILDFSWWSLVGSLLRYRLGKVSNLLMVGSWDWGWESGDVLSIGLRRVELPFREPRVGRKEGRKNTRWDLGLHSEMLPPRVGWNCRRKDWVTVIETRGGPVTGRSCFIEKGNETAQKPTVAAPKADKDETTRLKGGERCEGGGRAQKVVKCEQALSREEEHN